jgi:hypothetical protein
MPVAVTVVMTVGVAMAVGVLKLHQFWRQSVAVSLDSEYL